MKIIQNLQTLNCTTTPRCSEQTIIAQTHLHHHQTNPPSPSQHHLIILFSPSPSHIQSTHNHHIRNHHLNCNPQPFSWPNEARCATITCSCSRWAALHRFVCHQCCCHPCQLLSVSPLFALAVAGVAIIRTIDTQQPPLWHNFSPIWGRKEERRKWHFDIMECNVRDTYDISNAF